MELIVRNLPDDIDEVALQATFSVYGIVEKVKLLRDYETKKFKGTAFIIMPDFFDAKKAIETLDKLDLDGKVIRVSEARPPKKKKSPA